MNDRSYGVTVAVTAAEAHAEAARDQKVTETMLSRSLSLQCGEHAATHAKRALEEMFDSKQPEANAGEGRGSAEVVGSDGEASGSQQVEEEEGLEDDDKRVTICVFGQSGRRAAAVTRAASSARDEQPQSWIGWSEEKNPSVCATSLNGVSLEGRGNGFGGFSPVKPMKQLHITTGSRCMAT